MQSQFSTVEEALNQLVNGGYIILADNEDRENEGDLVALGENINADTIYEMLNEANGLMCVPVSEDIAKHLAFKPMVEHSTDPHQTPFMVTTDGTLEATGVTTGVSAFDRAATIRQIAKPTAQAAVDLAYLAGKAPVAVIIEVLKSDGKMARRDNLSVLANRVHVPFITINQIIEYLDAKGIDYAADLAKVNA